MRFLLPVFFAAVSFIQAATLPTAAQDARELFLATEYKRAARAFETAVALNPRNAALQNWLGKSYARLAESASPLTSRRYALRAQRHLAAAVDLEPDNTIYVRDLFEFYVDSPEWIAGGLRHAAALEPRLEGGRDTTGALDAARAEYSGPVWRFRQSILRSMNFAGGPILSKCAGPGME